MNVKPLTPTEARRARNRAGTARSVLRAQHNRPAECIIIRGRVRLCLPCTPRGRSGNRYVTETVTRSVRGVAQRRTPRRSLFSSNPGDAWSGYPRRNGQFRAGVPEGPALQAPDLAMRPAMDAASSCAPIAPEREAGPTDGRCMNPAAESRERPWKETLTPERMAGGTWRIPGRDVHGRHSRRRIMDAYSPPN